MSNNELLIAVRSLDVVNVSVSGCESLIGDTFSKVGAGLKRGGEAIGRAAMDKTISAVKEVNTALIKTMGTRRMFLSHLNSKLSKVDDLGEITFNKSLLSSVTQTGKPDNIVHSLETVESNISDVVTFVKDLEAYYNKEFALLKEIKNIKNTEQATQLIQKLDNLTLPTPKNVDVKEVEESKWFLPGGRSISYVVDSGKFSFNNEESVSATEVTESFAKDDFKQVLILLNKLTDLYKSISDLNVGYIDYMKKFNTVVGESTQHLASLRGEVSTSLLTELVNRLDGNTLVFTVFSGFLPKVVIYLDDYVETLSSHLSKQFN